MMRCFYLLMLGALLAFTAQAQQVQQSAWIASFNTFQLKNKWSLHADVQLRSTDNVKEVQTLLLRPGVNYHLSKSWVASAGYAYIAKLGRCFATQRAIRLRYTRLAEVFLGQDVGCNLAPAFGHFHVLHFKNHFSTRVTDHGGAVIVFEQVKYGHPFLGKFAAKS